MQWISSVLSPDRTGPLAALGLGNATSMSGAGASPDGRSSFGFALMRGKRPGMEDFHHAEYRKDTRSGETVGLFGVFDGHGGPNAADFVRSNLFKNLLQHPKWPGDIQRAIGEESCVRHAIVMLLSKCCMHVQILLSLACMRLGDAW